MARSNTPLALSVAALTEPGDIAATVERLLEFDTRPFGFSHDPTWAALPAALRGVLNPDSVEISLSKRPTRIVRCIKALCRLGNEQPRETHRFSDFPDARLRPISSIDWGPGISIRVKGVCWYVRPDGKPIIPLLQPRKSALDADRLALYARLGRQAYCQGDWITAGIDLIDLSGDDDDVVARIITENQLPKISDDDLALFVRTFVEAKALADAERAKRQPKDRPSKGDDLFDRPI